MTYNFILHHLFSFQGRIGRLQWWLLGNIGYLLLFVMIWATGFSDLEEEFSRDVVDSYSIFLLVIIIVMLILAIWINLAATVKRAHDLDQSGWVVLLFVVGAFIPYVGFLTAIIWLVWFGFFRGSGQQNTYYTDFATNNVRSELVSEIAVPNNANLKPQNNKPSSPYRQGFGRR